MDTQATPLIRRALTTLGLALVLGACGDDASSDPAIALDGAEATLSATFQSPAAPPAGTGGVELPIEDVVGAEPGTMTFARPIGAYVEFARFLGYWSIDVGPDTIEFKSTGKEPFPGAFSVFADDMYMRLTMSGLEGLEIADTDAANVEVDVGDDAVMITFGPGFDPSQPGLTIQLG